jgi:S-adenosylmethionine-diacylglycerol 3-amino-3-carboxypropyl transferase
MPSEAARYADFSGIRYAQCWEDADVLLAALDIQPGQVCLSIASAGDNTLAMLSRGPARVIAVDLSAAQLACLELRIAAYRELEHDELLELMGSRGSRRRDDLYRRCRKLLSAQAGCFWDAQPAKIAQGIGGAGRFERYFALFRTRILPLVHRRHTVERLLVDKPREAREVFYREEWDTWRWRLLFGIFFSRLFMGRLGRDPSFFRYVKGGAAERLLARTRYALTVLKPAENPYLQWILTGRHTTALPFALRPENFEVIRSHLNRLEWRQQSLEELLRDTGERAVDCFNLSDVFEYMSERNTARLLACLARAARPGGRLAYWNMLAPRRRPESLAPVLAPCAELTERLFAEDKAFFYNAFIVEEVRA